MLNELRKVLWKWNTIKYLNYYTLQLCQKKWIGINGLSRSQYSVNKNIRYKTPILRSNLCDYSESYILKKGTIDLLAAAAYENDKA